MPLSSVSEAENREREFPKFLLPQMNEHVLQLEGITERMKAFVCLMCDRSEFITFSTLGSSRDVAKRYFVNNCALQKSPPRATSLIFLSITWS